MKRAGFWLGIAMLALVGLVIVVGMVAKHGWPLIAFLVFVGLAVWLVIQGDE